MSSNSPDEATPSSPTLNAHGVRKRGITHKTKGDGMVPRLTYEMPEADSLLGPNSELAGAIPKGREVDEPDVKFLPHRTSPPERVHRDEKAKLENGTPVGPGAIPANDEQSSSSTEGEESSGDTSATKLLLPHEGHVGAKRLGVESSKRIFAQVFLPFLIAGFGMVGAGLLLDVVQHWPVYVNVSEVFILVPALLGLKGNLEMTLASRLSTAANLGSMDDSREKWKMIGGNMALTQCQAIVVGFLASVAAVLFGWLPDGEFDINDVLLLCASSLVTASLASGILGSIMVVVILFSRHLRINPDNVATPIAASLGDLTTLALLSWISDKIYQAREVDGWLAPIIIVGFLLVLPLWAVISHRNEYTHNVFYYGWSPVIAAMIISSCGGLVLDVAIRKNKGVAVFSPVINGVGGNLVAVQASRLATDLHSVGPPGTPIPGRESVCENPYKVFFGDGNHSRSARVLFLLVIPGQLIFLFLIAYANAGHSTINFRVTAMYMTVAMIQVALLLVIAECLIHIIWRRKNDPDNFAIPYLTALGDVLGTSLLAAGFYIVWLMGDRDVDIGD